MNCAWARGICSAVSASRDATATRFVNVNMACLSKKNNEIEKTDLYFLAAPPTFRVGEARFVGSKGAICEAWTPFSTIDSTQREHSNAAMRKLLLLRQDKGRTDEEVRSVHQFTY